MLKIIYTILHWLKPASPTDDDDDRRADPLSHPAIRSMDPDELADLPFPSMRRPC